MMIDDMNVTDYHRQAGGSWEGLREGGWKQSQRKRAAGALL